jgi:hypothetical protein
MTSLLIALAAGAAGWLLGTRTTRHIVNEELDRRLGRQVGQDVILRPIVNRPVATEQIPPETVAALAAAICAYLGKPARIRRVRRVQSGMNPWAQQGRVHVMASHTLSR